MVIKECRVYKQTISPLMDYGDRIIESASKTKLDRLQRLQVKALKYIDNNDTNTNIDGQFITYNILPLVSQRREHII